MRIFLIVSLISVVSPAAAHIELMSPAPRTLSQKHGPCGVKDDPRGAKITYFEPGATVTLRWTETVAHPGHYRIAFDTDGVDDLLNPPTPDSFYINDAVLLDDIADKEPNYSTYAAQVTLPNIECDNCTLQLIQVMTDAQKAPYDPAFDSNDVYYQCVDVALRVGGAPDEPEETEPPAGFENGCQSTSPLLCFLGLPLLAAACRRRSKVQ